MVFFVASKCIWRTAEKKDNIKDGLKITDTNTDPDIWIVIYMNVNIYLTVGEGIHTIRTAIELDSRGESVMGNTIKKWLVEEVDENTKTVLFSQSFDDETEAREMYIHLKEKTDNNLVSLTKSEKRLLNESN